MKYTDRAEARRRLEATLNEESERSKIVVITGRRRVGKTRFVREALHDTPNCLYFGVARKAEGLLCWEFAEEAKRKLAAPLPALNEAVDFRSLLKSLMALSKDRPITIVVDEFQEFNTINQNVWQDLQSLWDRNRERSRITLIFVGNDNRLTEAVFEGDHAPLAGRVADWIELQPLTKEQLTQVMHEANPAGTPDDLLAMWTFTGGVQGYVYDLIEHGAFHANDIIDVLTAKDSPYLYEGKQLLVEDFGKEYTIYFSILQCIAGGLISRAAIEEYVRKEIGGYLTRLETEFHLIEKQTPLFSRTGSKNVRYLLTDNFLRFWFRYIFAHTRLTETSRHDQLRDIVKQDYVDFARLNLKNYLRDQMKADPRWEQVGGWWDHRGDVLIDLIGYNTQTKEAEIVEVLRADADEDMNALVQKAAVLSEHLAGYTIEYKLKKQI